MEKAPASAGLLLPLTRNRLNMTDRHVRQKNPERIRVELGALEKRTGKTHLKTKYALLAHRSMVGYLKELKSSRLRVDQAKVKQAEKPDGKYLLSTSDKSLSAEDIALGYNSSWELSGPS